MKLINVRGSRRIAAGLCAGLCLLLPACRTQQTASSSEAGESSSSAARTAARGPLGHRGTDAVAG